MVGLTLWVLGPFLLPLFLGVIFAVALTGFQEKIMRTFHLGPKVSALLVSLIFALLVLGSLGVVATKFVGFLQGNSNFSQSLEKIKTEISAAIFSTGLYFRLPVNSDNINNLVRAFTLSAESFIIMSAKKFAAEFPSIVIQFVILVLAICTALMHYQRLVGKLLNTNGSSNGFSRLRLMQIKDIIATVCKDIVLVNILTVFAQSILVALGAAFLTDVDAMTVFVITFIVGFVPVIGASPIAGILGVIQLFQHNYTEGILLLALMGVVSIADNITRAWFLSRKSGGGSAFLNFLSVIGGIYVWGFPGVFLGPIVMSFSLRLLPLLVKEANRESLLKGVEGKPAA